MISLIKTLTMQVGSIVAVKKVIPSYLHKARIEWLPIMDEKTPYTIREIEKDVTGEECARLEEGVIGYNSSGLEYAIGLEDLIELLPPAEGELTELLEYKSEKELVNT